MTLRGVLEDADKVGSDQRSDPGAGMKNGATVSDLWSDTTL